VLWSGLTGNHSAAMRCGVFNAPCRLRAPAQSEAFRNHLPTAVGHFSARNRHKSASKILRFKLPVGQEITDVSCLFGNDLAACLRRWG